MRRNALMLLRRATVHADFPERAETLSGVVFNPTSDVWSYRDGTYNVHIDHTSFDWVHTTLAYGIRKVLLVRVEKAAPSSVMAYYRAFVHFANFLKSSSKCSRKLCKLSVVDYLNYRAGGGIWTGHVKTLLKQWYRLGLKGVDDTLMEAIASTKDKGRRKGVPVATMDPITGPFTDIEYESLQATLNDAYVAGELDTSDFVLAWLFMAIGGRPVQYASMKVKDIRVSVVGESVEYSVDVPRAKQKSTLSRTEFRNRPLVPQIGQVVARYAASVRSSFSNVLVDPAEAALFPMATVREWPAGWAHHQTANSLGLRFSTAIERLKVPSPRTGKAMNITGLRFRRTFGTRAAQEGHGALVIAELLDHTDTQHVGVYVEVRPDIVERIDKAVALELAPIAQAFKGKLIATESEATRAGDPSSRIRDLRVDSGTLASCGKHSFCTLNAPIACYTCNSFEPWLDGPHQAVLDALFERRRKQLGSLDARMATINDRTILAVAHVIRLCKERREEGASK